MSVPPSDNFFQKVYATVSRIPRGRVMSYGQIARHLGAPRAARAVGYALRACHDPGLPWHRVVNASGGISSRARQSSLAVQRQRLEAEGVVFTEGKLDLSKYRYNPEE